MRPEARAAAAGATGLNLQAADTVINVDLPWNPAVLEQQSSRAHCIGGEAGPAALDPASDVTAVDLSSGVEELKRRLEVLIGARPDAPLDVSQERQVGAGFDMAVRSYMIPDKDLTGG